MNRLLTVLTMVFCVTAGRAQTDPKLTPGDSVKVTKMVLTKKATGRKPGDSVADVRVEYIKPDGSPGVLHLANVGYSKGDSAERKAHVKLDDGTEMDLTPQEVKDWLQGILQDPPDIIYYVDGLETPRAAIKRLERAKIRTVNKYKGEEAASKYGERARNGVIVFTTR